MATIRQIAALAGVSRGTVDRVLNNRGVVNPETAAKIREIAEAMQYTPNRVARTLAVKKKNIKLGYLMFSGSNPFFEEVVAGIRTKAKELEEYGATVDIRFSDFGSAAHQTALMEEMAADGVQGIAVTPINHPDVARKMQELAGRGIPTVTANTDIENSGRIAYVGSDYTQSGKTAGGLMRLVTDGRAKIGIVVGSMDVLCHSERVAGFTASIAKHCPQSEILEIAENHDDEFESFDVTKELLTRHPETSALFMASAGVYGACRAVEALGLQKKIKIVSFDCVPSTKELIRRGVITATICQQPLVQGARPLDILFNLLGMGIQPDRDKYYTELEIKIRENL